MANPIQSIELDCAPGEPRPDAYIKGVIQGTGLPEREPAGKFFGNWRWDYTDISREEWNRITPILRDRIIALYEKNCIRFGSW